MAPGRTPKWWTPQNAEQKKAFDAGKDDVIIALSVCKEGVQVGKCMNIIAESTGSMIPFRKMGFNNFQEFLFHIDDVLEVRGSYTDPNRYYLFVRESVLSEECRHIRRLVEGQHNAKLNRGQVRATIRNTKPATSEVLLNYTYRPPFVPPGVGGFGVTRPHHASTSRYTTSRSRGGGRPRGYAKAAPYSTFSRPAPLMPTVMRNLFTTSYTTPSAPKPTIIRNCPPAGEYMSMSASRNRPDSTEFELMSPPTPTTPGPGGLTSYTSSSSLTDRPGSFRSDAYPVSRNPVAISQDQLDNQRPVSNYTTSSTYGPSDFGINTIKSEPPMDKADRHYLVPRNSTSTSSSIEVGIASPVSRGPQPTVHQIDRVPRDFTNSSPTYNFTETMSRVTRPVPIPRPVPMPRPVPVQTPIVPKPWTSAPNPLVNRVVYGIDDSSDREDDDFYFDDEDSDLTMVSGQAVIPQKPIAQVMPQQNQTTRTQTQPAATNPTPDKYVGRPAIPVRTNMRSPEPEPTPTTRTQTQPTTAHATPDEHVGRPAIPVRTNIVRSPQNNMEDKNKRSELLESKGQQGVTSSTRTGFRGEGDAGLGRTPTPIENDDSYTDVSEEDEIRPSLRFRTALESYIRKNESIDAANRAKVLESVMTNGISHEDDYEKELELRTASDEDDLDWEYPVGLGPSDVDWIGRNWQDPRLPIPMVRVRLLKMTMVKLAQYKNGEDFNLVVVQKEKDEEIDKLTSEMTLWYNVMKDNLPVIECEDLSWNGCYAGFDRKAKKWERFQLDLKDGVFRDEVLALNIDSGIKSRIPRTDLRYLLPKFAKVPRRAYSARMYSYDREPRMNRHTARNFDNFMEGQVGKLFRASVIAQVPDIYNGVPLLIVRLLTLVSLHSEMEFKDILRRSLQTLAVELRADIPTDYRFC